MKRDFDLIRKILLYVEENHDGNTFIMHNLDGYENNVFIYHCKLLSDVGLLDGEVEGFLGPEDSEFVCRGLTWAGQDYLANIKNDTVWNKVKKTALEKGIDLTLDIIATLAAKYTKKIIKG